MKVPDWADRFWSKTKPVWRVEYLDTPCLIWQGALKKPWYGRDFAAGGQAVPCGKFWYQGRAELAHRVSMHLKTGIPIKELPLVAHQCDQYDCVSWDHLELSDPSRNLQEAHDRGRRDPDSILMELCSWFDTNPIR